MYRAPAKSCFHVDFNYQKNASVFKNMALNTIPPNNALIMGSGADAPTWQPSYGGKTLAFDGTDYLKLTNDTNIDKTSFGNTSRLAIYALFKITTAQSGYIIAKNSDSTANMQYALRYTTIGGNFFVLSLENGDRVTSNQTVVLNKWYWIVCDWDSVNARMFINGKLDNSAAYASGTLTSRANFRIGARSNAADGNTMSIFFAGNIAMVGMAYGVVSGYDIDNWAKSKGVYRKWRLM